jgi:hypothetical protein
VPETPEPQKELEASPIAAKAKGAKAKKETQKKADESPSKKAQKNANTEEASASADSPKAKKSRNQRIFTFFVQQFQSSILYTISQIIIYYNSRGLYQSLAKKIKFIKTKTKKCVLNFETIS